MNILQKAKKILKVMFSTKKEDFPLEASDEDKLCMRQSMPISMASPQRLYATLSSTKYIIANKIPGAFVECGVWRGGNTAVMCRTLINYKEAHREIYLFDTFSGMTEPTDFDYDSTGGSAKIQLSVTQKNDGNSIWCIASLDDVKKNISDTAYPSNLVHYVEGDVVKTLEIDANLPESIALLRLDTDWYESTKKELEVLFPRLVKGGVCLVDDYGHWQGARKALDEYLAAHGIFPLMHVTDYTGRAFIKY
jgi:O-methyltransferase